MAGGVINKIVAGGNTHSISATFYGTCSTAAATAAKEVIINDPATMAATFEYGMTLAVKFTKANGVASPTITCFNNSGTKAAPTKGGTTLLAAKEIKKYGTTDPGNSAVQSWAAGSVVMFVYDGTYWQMVNWLNTDTNDNTVPSVYIDTAAATADKVGTMTNGVLRKGYYIVSITTSNTAASALTLNINGKGAKSVYINGTASSDSNYSLPAGSYIVFYSSARDRFYFRTDGKIPLLKNTGSITETSTSITVSGTTLVIPAAVITSINDDMT